MRVRLKLSITHDMDIITLTQCQFPVSEWIKISLKSYVEDGHIINIPLPETPEQIRYEKCEINFSLHEEKEKNIINWLKSLRIGQRSGAIKSIFRCSLSAPCLAGHHSNCINISTNISRDFPSVTPSVSHKKNSQKKKESETNITDTIIPVTNNNDDDFDVFDFNPER